MSHVPIIKQRNTFAPYEKHVFKRAFANKLYIPYICSERLKMLVIVRNNLTFLSSIISYIKHVSRFK